MGSERRLRNTDCVAPNTAERSFFFFFDTGVCERRGSQSVTVNSDNSTEEEIQHTITLGNKAHYANQFLFKSRLVSKKSKLKQYWSINGDSG